MSISSALLFCRVGASESSTNGLESDIGAETEVPLEAKSAGRDLEGAGGRGMLGSKGVSPFGVSAVSLKCPENAGPTVDGLESGST